MLITNNLMVHFSFLTVKPREALENSLKRGLFGFHSVFHRVKAIPRTTYGPYNGPIPSWIPGCTPLFTKAYTAVLRQVP